MSNPEIDQHGTKKWSNQKGEAHRLDGPAIEYTDGDISYYINSQTLTEAEWNAHPLRKNYIIKENLKKILK